MISACRCIGTQRRTRHVLLGCDVCPNKSGSHVPGSFTPQSSLPWGVDEGIPYPYSDASGTGEMQDSPDLPNRSLPCSLHQDFVTCLVCRDPGRCGDILGCVAWGHSFYKVGNTRWVIRYVRGTDDTYAIGPSSEVGDTVVVDPANHMNGKLPMVDADKMQLVAGASIKACCDARHYSAPQPFYFFAPFIVIPNKKPRPHSGMA